MVAILIGLGPLIGWGIYPTIASKFGGKPVNQILGSTLGTLIFAIVYNQIEHLGFPHGMDLLLAILSGVGWACAQIVTFYSFTLIGSSRAMPVTTAFQLLGASLWGVVALGDWPTVGWVYCLGVDHSRRVDDGLVRKENNRRSRSVEKSSHCFAVW